jgi:hypothetical protein
MLDGVSQCLLQRQLNLELMADDAWLVAERLRDPVGHCADCCGVCGNHDIELAGRAEWQQRAEAPRRLEPILQLLDESLLCLLGVIALAEGLRQLVNVQPQLQLGNGLAPKRSERPLLLGRERPGNAIKDTETPKRVAIVRDQRRSHVEADPGLADNERVVAEALVGQRIWNDEQVVLLDRVRTKSDAARGFRRAGAQP